MRTNRTAASSSDALRDFGPGASGLSCPPSVTYRRYVRNAMPSGGARQCAESVTKLTLRGRPALSSPRATNLSAELLVLATEQRKSSICPQGRASRWAWHGCLQFDRPPPSSFRAAHLAARHQERRMADFARNRSSWFWSTSDYGSASQEVIWIAVSWDSEGQELAGSSSSRSTSEAIGRGGGVDRPTPALGVRRGRQPPKMCRR